MSTSIQTAASLALSEFLADKLTGVSVFVGWPAPNKSLPAKAVSIVTSGPRRDIPIDRKLLQSTNNGNYNVDAVWQIAACTQAFQLDVWAHSDFERDAIMADLDIYLNYGERGLGAGNYDVGSGVLLNIGNGWDNYDSKADFFFGEPDTLDSSEANSVKSFRGIYRGDAHFMLAIPSTSPRQLVIYFSQFLDGESDSDVITYNTTDN